MILTKWSIADAVKRSFKLFYESIQ